MDNHGSEKPIDVTFLNNNRILLNLRTGHVLSIVENEDYYGFTKENRWYFQI